MINLSCLVTCKDKEPFLDECIQSINRQSEPPKEIIIVHDGCKEPQHHALATSIFLKNNIGVARARHEAFRYSKQDLIIFIDGDDVVSPDYFEKMVIQITDGADVAYPDIFFWQEAASSGLSISLPAFAHDWILENKKFPIPVTCMMKREVYEAVGGFKDFPVLEDLDFWLRALCKGYTFRKANTLLWYRQIWQNRNNIDEQKRNQIKDEIFSQFTLNEGKICLK